MQISQIALLIQIIEDFMTKLLDRKQKRDFQKCLIQDFAVLTLSSIYEVLF